MKYVALSGGCPMRVLGNDEVNGWTASCQG